MKRTTSGRTLRGTASLGWTAAAAFIWAMPGVSAAADITKADNSTDLNTGSSWIGGARPGTGNVALFDSTLSAANSTLSIGATTNNFSAYALRVEDVQGGLLTLIVNAVNEQIRPYAGGLIVTNSADLSIPLGTLSQYSTGGATWRIGPGRTVSAYNISPNYQTLILNEGTMIGTNSFTLGIGVRSNTYTVPGNGTLVAGAPGLVKPFTVGGTAWLEADSLNYVNRVFFTNGTIIAYSDIRLSGSTWNVSESSFHDANVFAEAYLDVAYGNSSRATATISGNSAVTSMTVRVGRAGFGTLNVDGGALSTDDLQLGILGGAGQVSTGTVHLTAGSITTRSLEMQSSGGADVRGYFTVGGGTLSVGEVTKTGAHIAGNDTAFTFDGGTVKPLYDNAAWIGGGGTSGSNFTTRLTANGAIIDTDGYSVTISNVLENAPSQTGVLTKKGAGALALAADNTYSGATTVEDGSLIVNGGMGGGLITVKSGAMLGGSSAGAGPVTLDGGARLSPGNSIGTLGVGDLTLEGTTTWFMELAADGSTSDRVSLSGVLSAGTTFTKVTLDFLGGGVNGGSYVLIPTFASVSGLASEDFVVQNLAGGLSGTVDLNPTSRQLTLSVVPEPASIGTLGLLAVVMILRRRGAI